MNPWHLALALVGCTIVGAVIGGLIGYLEGQLAAIEEFRKHRDEARKLWLKGERE